MGTEKGEGTEVNGGNGRMRWREVKSQRGQRGKEKRVDGSVEAGAEAGAESAGVYS